MLSTHVHTVVLEPASQANTISPVAAQHNNIARFTVNKQIQWGAACFRTVVQINQYADAAQDDGGGPLVVILMTVGLSSCQFFAAILEDGWHEPYGCRHMQHVCMLLTCHSVWPREESSERSHACPQQTDSAPMHIL